MASPVEIGIAGAGVFGGYHAAKFASLPGARLVGVYDLDADRAAALAGRHGVGPVASFDELVAMCAAVVVATPATNHGEQALAAIAAGRAVLVEKPLAATAMQAALVAERAEAQGVVVQVGHQERAVFAALGILASDERPMAIESVRAGPWSGRAADVSVTLDLMIHDLDLVALLFGSPAAIDILDARSEHGGIDAVSVRLAFEGGQTAMLSSSRVAPERTRTMRLSYASGSADVDFLRRTLDNGSGIALAGDFAERVADPLAAADAAFLAAISGHGPTLADARAGAAAVAVAERIDGLAREWLRTAAQGR